MWFQIGADYTQSSGPPPTGWKQSCNTQLTLHHNAAHATAHLFIVTLRAAAQDVRIKYDVSSRHLYSKGLTARH